MVLAGLISALGRRGRRGRFVALEDHTGRLEVALFDEIYNRFADRLIKDEIIVVEGKVSIDDFSGGYRMTANDVMLLSEAKSRFARGLRITIQGPQSDIGNRLESTFAPYRNGSAPVYIDYRNQRARARLELGSQWTIKPCEELVAALNELEAVSEARLIY